MGDFKTIAKTGSDFVMIVFELVSDNVDNVTVELSVGGMRMKTYICDPGDSSLTIQPLAEGSYNYTVSQITEDGVKSSKGYFEIKDSHKAYTGTSLTY